ncbi:MAG: hypothetical protein KDC95_21615 [Planctomycetes bacterium]|nr:hypothetical protein [Planctomycetota bacterium]
MSRSAFLSLAVACSSLACGVAAQTTQSAYSRLDFDNAYRRDDPVPFPGSQTTQGSGFDDFVYKAFPAEVGARNKTWRISGFRIGFRVDKSYQGSLPTFVALPDVTFYPLVPKLIDGKFYDVPDLTKPIPTIFQLGAVKVLTGGVQNLDVRLGPHQPDPRLRDPIDLPARDSTGNPQGWAMVVYAPFGQRLGDGQPNFLCVPSFGEIHRTGGRSSYSGLYDSKTRALVPFGTTNAPSNLGEFAIELYFDQPTLQVFSDGSGGVRNDPRNIETHKGPGAYDNGLATAISPGFFGLYVQHESTSGLCALPVVVSGTAMPTLRAVIGDAELLVDPSGMNLVTLFTGAGIFGMTGTYTKGGPAGHRTDQAGVWQSGRMTIQPSNALIGLSFWVQALLYDPAKLRVVDSTNAVRIAF